MNSTKTNRNQWHAFPAKIRTFSHVIKSSLNPRSSKSVSMCLELLLLPAIVTSHSVSTEKNVSWMKTKM